MMLSRDLSRPMVWQTVAYLQGHGFDRVVNKYHLVIYKRDRVVVLMHDVVYVCGNDFNWWYVLPGELDKHVEDGFAEQYYYGYPRLFEVIRGI